jgi:hypothetical protein
MSKVAIDYKNRPQFVVMTKRNGQNEYLCTSLDEDSLVRDLQQMYREHSRKYRRDEADGKNVPPFNAYGLVIVGNTSRRIDVGFFKNRDEEETYEDVVNGDAQ